MPDPRILISDQPLDLPLLNSTIQVQTGQSGASVIFTGNVRVSKDEQGLRHMILEHYPGMTENLLTEILDAATERWNLTQVFVAHRIGKLLPGEPIVLVASCALHRKEAFEATEYVMDYLKNKATFWKKEVYQDEHKLREVWVASKQSDTDVLNRW